MKKSDYKNTKSKIDYNNETKKVRRQVKQQKSQKTPQHQPSFSHLGHQEIKQSHPRNTTKQLKP